jgi:phage baseplate assembly protein W
MPTYIGFSTQYINQSRTAASVATGQLGGQGSVVAAPPQGRKYRTVDGQLVQIDLLNAFNIRRGDKVGQPNYGTTIWSYMFEPATENTRAAMETEIRRVANQDPRFTVNNVDLYEYNNGILIEIQGAVSPFNSEVQMKFYLSRDTNRATAM